MFSYINRLLAIPYLTLVLKLLSMGVFIILLISGFSAYSQDAAFLNYLRNTNLGNLLVWSFWWPAIILAAVFVGRVWCMVCPMELLSSCAARWGLKKRAPRWLQSGWAITFFYALVLFGGIQGLAIHRNPTYMASYLLTIMVVAVIIGLIYEKNAFCRYVCPVGFLLGIYARLAPVGWRVKSESRCRSCKDKSCINREYNYNVDAKSCGMGLYPAKAENMSQCILCTGCMKSCAKYQIKSPCAQRPNPGLQFVGFAADLLKAKAFTWAQLAFVVMVSGFVISELWTEWGVTKQILNSISGFVLEPMGLKGSVAKIAHGIIIFLILPLFFWFAPYLIAKAAGAKLPFKKYLSHYALAFVPIIASAHVAKALLKSSTRIPYFEHLPHDINGMHTAQRILDKSITLSALPSSVSLSIYGLCLLITILGMALSAYMVKRLNHQFGLGKAAYSFYFIPLAYGAIFMGMLLAWRIF